MSLEKAAIWDMDGVNDLEALVNPSRERNRKEGTIVPLKLPDYLILTSSLGRSFP